MKLYVTLFSVLLAASAWGQQAETVLTYNVETSATVSNGKYAPVWLSSNRFGMGSVENNNGYLRAGINFEKILNHNWKIESGFQMASGFNVSSNFWIQQAYADFSWKMLNISKNGISS